jgi:multidrug efflux pump subunit AcrA (membrane-fusion protein)
MITARTLPNRRALVPLGLVPVVVGAIILGLHGGGPAAAEDAPAATAEREDLVVTVGGVGRIVQAKAAKPIATPSAAAGTTGTSGSTPTEAPPDAVFPRAAGRISKFLVAPGALVVSGQPLALLDDGGAAASGVRQAQNDLSTALVELRQKRTSDPLQGIPATSAQVTPRP